MTLIQVFIIKEFLIQLLSAVVMLSLNISNSIVRMFCALAMHWNTALLPTAAVWSRGGCVIAASETEINNN